MGCGGAGDFLPLPLTGAAQLSEITGDKEYA